MNVTDATLNSAESITWIDTCCRVVAMEMLVPNILVKWVFSFICYPLDAFPALVVSAIFYLVETRSLLTLWNILGVWPNVQPQRQSAWAPACTCWSSQTQTHLHLWNVWERISRNNSAPDSYENPYGYVIVELKFIVTLNVVLFICGFISL